MYLEWFHIIALLFAIPGSVVLVVGLGWAVMISWTVFTAKKGMVDGLSAIGGMLGLIIIIGVASVFFISISIFGTIGILYGISFFSLFSILIFKLLFG